MCKASAWGTTWGTIECDVLYYVMLSATLYKANVALMYKLLFPSCCYKCLFDKHWLNLTIYTNYSYCKCCNLLQEKCSMWNDLQVSCNRKVNADTDFVDITITHVHDVMFTMEFLQHNFYIWIISIIWKFNHEWMYRHYYDQWKYFNEKISLCNEDNLVFKNNTDLNTGITIAVN